jgi:hypothetical protein
MWIGTGWAVKITKTMLYTSELIELIKCKTREEAYQTYRHVMKEMGKGF